MGYTRSASQPESREGKGVCLLDKILGRWNSRWWITYEGVNCSHLYMRNTTMMRAMLVHPRSDVLSGHTFHINSLLPIADFVS